MPKRFYSRLSRKKYQEKVREVEYSLDGNDELHRAWIEHMRNYEIKQKKEKGKTKEIPRNV